MDGESPTKNCMIDTSFVACTTTLQASSNLSLSIYKSPKQQQRWDFWLPKPNPTGSRLSKNDLFSKFGSRTQKLWNVKNLAQENDLFSNDRQCFDTHKCHFFVIIFNEIRNFKFLHFLFSHLINTKPKNRLFFIPQYHILQWNLEEKKGKKRRREEHDRLDGCQLYFCFRVFKGRKNK